MENWKTKAVYQAMRAASCAAFRIGCHWIEGATTETGEWYGAITVSRFDCQTWKGCGFVDVTWWILCVSSDGFARCEFNGSTWLFFSLSLALSRIFTSLDSNQFISIRLFFIEFDVFLLSIGTRWIGIRYAYLAAVSTIIYSRLWFSRWVDPFIGNFRTQICFNLFRAACVIINKYKIRFQMDFSAAFP